MPYILVIIVADNRLLPSRQQTIIWTNDELSMSGKKYVLIKNYLKLKITKNTNQG